MNGLAEDVESLFEFSEPVFFKSCGHSPPVGADICMHTQAAEIAETPDAENPSTAARKVVSVLSGAV